MSHCCRSIYPAGSKGLSDHPLSLSWSQPFMSSWVPARLCRQQEAACGECHIVPTSRGRVRGHARSNPLTPCIDPAAVMVYVQCPGHSPAWAWVHSGAPQVLAHIRTQDGPLAGKAGACNNAGREPLAFVLFKFSVQNKRAKGMAWKKHLKHMQCCITVYGP